MTKPGTSLPVRLANFVGAVFLRHDLSLTRTDILACLVIGEAAAGMLHFVIPIWEFPDLLLGASRAAFVAAPLGALGVVYGGIYLGRRWLSAVCFSKFVLVGVLNTLIDFSVFNLLMDVSGITRGPLFAFFKAVSFSLAVVNSYLWNRYWCFRFSEPRGCRSQPAPGKQFSLFASVSLVGLLLNAAIATVLVHQVEPIPVLSLRQWANAAAGLALVVSTVWNFCAYRFLVFSAENPSKEPALLASGA